MRLVVYGNPIILITLTAMKYRKVEYLWDFVGDVSYMVLGIVKVFRRPLNITIHHNTFYACSKAFEVYRGLYGYASPRTVDALHL